MSSGLEAVAPLEHERAPAGSLAEVLTLDLRSLAAFRVALGAVLLADLLARAADLTAFFTDLGVLPRASFPAVNADWVFSLNLAAGSAAGQAVLFLAAGASALALLAGLHTRLATAACFLFWHSLQARNVYVDDGGDMLLMALLFWALLLPLGARFSLDALRAPPRSDPPTSTHGLPAAALLLQLFVVYALAAVHKAKSPTWIRGETLWYVTHLDQLATPLGLALGSHTTLCHLGTWGALAFELLGPTLLFIPWKVERLRTVAALAFVGLHLAFGAVMRLGLFPWVGMVAWTAVLPWPAYQAIFRRLRLSKIAARLSGWSSVLRALLPPGPAPEAEPGAAIRALAGAAALLLLAWNLTTVSPALEPLQHAFEPGIRALRLDQEWLMFDGAPREDGWFVAEGKLADGSSADLLTGGAVRFDHPADIAARYGSQRWMNWQKSLADPTNEALLPLWASWLCRSWNDAHPPAQHAARLQLHWVAETTLPDREAPPQPALKLDGACRDPAAAP